MGLVSVEGRTSAALFAARLAGVGGAAVGGAVAVEEVAVGGWRRVHSGHLNGSGFGCSLREGRQKFWG